VPDVDFLLSCLIATSFWTRKINHINKRKETVKFKSLKFADKFSEFNISFRIFSSKFSSNHIYLLFVFSIHSGA